MLSHTPECGGIILYRTDFDLLLQANLEHSSACIKHVGSHFPNIHAIIAMQLM
jgi:hypothetical protein